MPEKPVCRFASRYLEFGMALQGCTVQGDYGEQTGRVAEYQKLFKKNWPPQICSKGQFFSNSFWYLASPDNLEKDLLTLHLSPNNFFPAKARTAAQTKSAVHLFLWK